MDVGDCGMHNSGDRDSCNVKTCMVVYSYYPFDPRVRKEVRALVAKGYSVDIICLRDQGEHKCEEVDGAMVYRLLLAAIRGGYSRYLYQYAMFFLMSFILLIKLHFKKRYDVIHVHTLPDFQVFTSLIPKLFGSKVILDLHEAMPEIFAARFGLNMDSGGVKLAMFLEKISCSFADRIITVNDTINERISRRTSYQDEITVVMNSPDESLSSEKDMSNFVAEHNLEGKVLIVYVGGINKERNLETLIKASSIIKNELPIHLVIFGYGKEEYKNELRALARDLDLANDVHFGGWVPHEDALSYMNLSEVGVVSYMDNPLTQVAVPNKVFEFASLGKPLIIARLEALERLYENAALFYEPENSEDLASKILQLYKNKDLAKKLVLGAKRAYNKCKWDIMKNRLYEVYKNLLC